MKRHIKLFENFLAEEVIKNVMELKPVLQGYSQLSKDSESALYQNFQYGRAYVELDSEIAAKAGHNVSVFLFANDPRTGDLLMKLGNGAKAASAPSGRLTDANGQTINYYYFTHYSVPTDTATFSGFMSSINSILSTGKVLPVKAAASAGAYSENDMVFLTTGESAQIVSYDPVKNQYQVRLTSLPNAPAKMVNAANIKSRDFAATVLGDEFMSAYRKAVASVYGGSGGKDTDNIIKAQQIMVSAMAADPEMKASRQKLAELEARAKQENKGLDQYPEKAQLDAKIMEITRRIEKAERTKNPDVFASVPVSR